MAGLGLTVTKGRCYLPKGSVVTPWYMKRIPIISNLIHLQRGRSRSTVTVTSFLYQRWRVWALLASRRCSYSPRKHLLSDDVFVLSSCWAPLINACSGNGVLSVCILIISWHWIAHPPIVSFIRPSRPSLYTIAFDGNSP